MTGRPPVSVDEWLAHLEALRPEVIDLGLDRVRIVAERLGLTGKTCPVLIVGGTNGKGSVCAMLDSVLRCAGYRVGLYTSPHLLRFQERIVVDGREIDDDPLCAAFAEIEQARGEVALTYFEFSTLAALIAFRRANVDVMVLEVGLGGRLDAVNALDADCAVITSVDLDHQAFLGDTREAIGFEKAGIFRAGRPAVCADPDPPSTLVEHARAVGADLWRLGVDFGFQFDAQQWSYWGREWRRPSLTWPALRGHYQLQNAAAVLAALESVVDLLPVSMGDVRRGLLEVSWPGRFQVLAGRPTVVLDVAHNPHAAKALRSALDQMGYFPRTHAVLGMLHDKDIGGVLKRMTGAVDHWYLADLDGPRAASADELARALDEAGDAAPRERYADPEQAFAEAYKRAADNDRILIFGSFYTVSAVLAQTQSRDYRKGRDGR